MPHHVGMIGLRRVSPRASAFVVAGALTAVAAVAFYAAKADETIGGSGLRYHGEMYWSSDATVMTSALGEELEHNTQFEDTTADVRRIRGVDADRALALKVHGRSAPADEEWKLFSTKATPIGDPWSDDELRQVVGPQP